MQNIKKLEHIAIIMDGNRRFAIKNQLNAFDGHLAGKEVLKNIVKHWVSLDIPYLSVYALSLSNLNNRQSKEKDYLYNIIADGIDEITNIYKDTIKINILGNYNLTNNIKLINSIENSINATKNNTQKYFNIAICYDGREEIIKAYRDMIKDNIDINKINELTVKKYLFTKDLPYVDLLIRTGGEYRLSGFLLWDISYSELFFTDKLFPEFNTDDFNKAIDFYNQIERRFGR